MYIISICIFLSALLLAFAFTPLVKMIARKLGIVDCPNSRKIHKGLIPRLGGVSIFASVVIVSILYFIFSAPYVASHGSIKVFISILVGASLMLMLGLADDMRRMRASRKFVLQLAIASIVYILGFRVEYIRFFDGIIFNLGVFSYPFTVLWIVGITNAVNLVDGMDGLASGLSLISFFFIAIIAILFGNYHVAILSFAFCGALIGFMRYNFHPATIFMGDSGSLFLGFILSIFSIQAMRNGHLQFSILVSVLILAIPMLDTALAITRRFVKHYVKSETGEKSIVFTIKKILYPDNEHIHHRLLARELSQREVSLRLYGVALLCGLIAIAFNYLSDNMVILLLTSLTLATLKFIDYLDYKEFSFGKKFASYFGS